MAFGRQVIILIWHRAQDARDGQEADLQIGPIGPAARGLVVRNCERRLDAGEDVAWSIVPLRSVGEPSTTQTRTLTTRA